MAVKWIAFHLTDRCNLNCRHCLRDPDLVPKDLELELIARVLDQAKADYGTAHVALTGGEPTLHPRFREVLDLVAERGMTWHMVTNGSRFPQLLEWLDEVPARRDALTAIDLSVDGAREETHDRIRGEGSFRETLAAAAQCTASGIPFVIQMTVNAQNLEEIDELGLLAAQLGATRASFAWLQATGTHADATLGLSAAEWRRVKDRVERLASVLAIQVSMPEGHYQPQPFHVCDPFRSETLHIDVEGQLNLCCQHSGIPADGSRSDRAGDMRDMSLRAGHRRLLDIIHATQVAKLEATEEERSEWDLFPCNWCMKHFGKPHWSAEGAAGPSADRERWRGAWAGGEPGKRHLRIA